MDDDGFNKPTNEVFSSHFESTDDIISTKNHVKPEANRWSSESTTSSSDNFGRVFFRKLSSCRKPTLNRPNADQNRKTDYVVEISCIFIRLGEIDTLHETFFAEAFLQAKWIDKNLNANDLYDPERNWNPDIIIENAIKGLSIKKTYSIKERENYKKGAIVCEKWIFKGIFWQSLKLKNFPIDVQELTISLASLKPISELKFKQSAAKISAVIQEGFIDQQEWKLYSFVTCKEVLVSHKFSVDEYPSYLITAYTCRRPNYYYYNAFFLIFLITLSSLTTFSMPCDLPQSRLQTTCTVLLTSITFKWVINRSLPTVYYLTSLDFYSLMNIVQICAKCCWHALVGYLNNTAETPVDKQDNFSTTKRVKLNRAKTEDVSRVAECKENFQTYDNIAFYLFLFAFILTNLVFTYWFFIKAKRESNKLDEKELRFINDLKKDDEIHEKTLTRKYRYTSMYQNTNKRKATELESNTKVNPYNGAPTTSSDQNNKNGSLSLVSNNIHLEHIDVKPNNNNNNLNAYISKNTVKRATSHLSFSLRNQYEKHYHKNHNFCQTPILTSLHDRMSDKEVKNDMTQSPSVRPKSHTNIFSIHDAIKEDIDI